METINILWTGGLDSTFRICELSFASVVVQPYYIIDPNRKSVPYELKAMRRILKLLRERSQTMAEIKDPITIQMETIPHAESISKAQNYLNSKYKLGGQYEFIANFTKVNNLKLEVGLESSHRSKAATALQSEAVLQLNRYSNSSESDVWGTYLVVDSIKSTPMITTIFENLKMPYHLFNIEKKEEVALMKEWGLEKVMKYTWFCHNPVLGYPCGHCNPCKDALNEGLAWRVPATGRILGLGRKIIIAPLKLLKKLIG